MRIVIAAMIVALSVGVVKAQTPDWVTGKSSTYPDELYITGVGSGDTRQEAENQARAQIAEVFKVQLNARFVSNKTETLNGADGKVGGESVDLTRSSVNVGLVKTLEGTEIADVWQDPNDMEYYALAVLNRPKASARLADQISELDTELVAIGKEIDTAGSKLGKLRLLASRKTLAVRRQDFNSDYSVLSNTGQGLPLPGISADEARTKLVRFCQNELVFSISEKGAGSKSAAQVLSDELTSQGLVIADSESAPVDFVVRVSSSLDPSDTPLDGWYYCRWNIGIRIIDNEKGSVISEVSKSGRSGQLTIGRAKERAIYDMDKAVKEMTLKITNRLMGE